MHLWSDRLKSLQQTGVSAVVLLRPVLAELIWAISVPKSKNHWCASSTSDRKKDTPPKTNMDTQNDGLEKVTPFKHGNFWYQFVRFLGCMFRWTIWEDLKPLFVSSCFQMSSDHNPDFFCVFFHTYLLDASSNSTMIIVHLQRKLV